MADSICETQQHGDGEVRGGLTVNITLGGDGATWDGFLVFDGRKEGL